MADVPVLRGERVVLRPIRASDRPAVRDMLAEPEVARWWGTQTADEAANDFIEETDAIVFAIEVDGVLAGAIQYAEETDPDYRHAAIDIALRTEYHDRGFGADALRTLARYLFDVLGHHRLTIDPSASNERAIHVYEKVGFRRVGVMRRYERGPDGTFHDGLLLDMLAGELR